LSMWPVIYLMPDLGSWPELIVKVMAGGAIYCTVAMLLNAAGARDMVASLLGRRQEQDAN